jgi:lipopolysaccharide/colanic/teichoic acid biosynthesis glycosyltransferase
LNFQASRLAGAETPLSGMNIEPLVPHMHAGPDGGVTTDQSGLPLHWKSGVPRPADLAPSRLQLAIKSLLDRLLAALALAFLLPLLLLIAATIGVTSTGPLVFGQWREGRNGRLFRVYKFRTMHIDRQDFSGTAQAQSGDGRVTAIGAFLRRTSLDELPQLWNVLVGQMSLVGPRPHVPDMLSAGRRYDWLVPYYHLRRHVKPGLTGWAQCNGLRGPTCDAGRAIARINHDLAYIQNFSLLLDFRIMLLTLRREFLSGSGS